MVTFKDFNHTLSSKNQPVQPNKHYHRKALLSSFRPNGETKISCTVSKCDVHCASLWHHLRKALLSSFHLNGGLRKQPATFRDAINGFPRNDVWETSAEVPYWWRITTQIRVPRGTTNQKHHPDLGSDTSSVCNFCAWFSDVISRGNHWWRREMFAVGYHLNGHMLGFHAQTTNSTYQKLSKQHL